MTQTPEVTPLGLNKWDENTSMTYEQFTEDNRLTDEAIQKAYKAENISQTAVAIPGIENPSVEDVLRSHNENSWNKTNLPIESGIWTPVLKGATTTGNPTYSSRSGSYERQGNLILVNFSLVITNKGGMAGSVAVDGLPFTSRGFFASTVGDGGGVNLPSGTVFSHMIVVNNTLNLVCKNNNGYVALDASQISDNFHFYHGTAFYRI